MRKSVKIREIFSVVLQKKILGEKFLFKFWSNIFYENNGSKCIYCISFTNTYKVAIEMKNMETKKAPEFPEL